MASGFIILADGRCLSVQHSLHDAVLKCLLNRISSDDPLHAWLGSQLPGEDDIELGYGFVRSATGEQVLRMLDLRGLTGQNRATLEDAALEAEPAAWPQAPKAQVEVALVRLREMIRRCNAGERPLQLSDWTIEAPPCTARVGPGWPE